MRYYDEVSLSLDSPSGFQPMSVAFDPYHKWLGIPPSQQPPSHYRLLGLEPFESDRDVIDAAANQRMVYLQDLAGGEHGSHSQTLLNQVSAARRCLLNPKSKLEYDSKLRAEQAPLPTVVVFPETSAQPTIDENASMFADLDLEVPVPPQDEKKRTSVRLDREKPLSLDVENTEGPQPRKRKRLWILGGVGVVALIGGLSAFLMSGKSEEAKVSANTSEAQTQQATKPTEPKKKTPEEIVEDRRLAQQKRDNEKEDRDKKEAAKKAQAAKKAEAEAIANALKNLPMPAFHFTPKGKILEVICDLVYFKDKYHLFYVAHPDDKTKVRSWGLAVSDDLFHWVEEKIEFTPKGSIVPGCVFLDKTKEGAPTLCAVLQTDTGAKSKFELKLATSLDGKKWTVEKDPILLPNLTDKPVRYRVMHDPETKSWLLALSRPANPKSKDPVAKVAQVVVYSSADLKEWKAHPALSLADAEEMVDLFSLPSTKPDQSKQAKLFLTNEKASIREVVFDGKSLTFPNKETLQLGDKIKSPRVFQMADRSRSAVVAIVDTTAPSFPQMTLPLELVLAQNQMMKPEFRRELLPEFSKLYSGEPVSQVEDLKLLAAQNPGIPKNANPIAASKLFSMEFELVREDKKAQAKIDIRGTKYELTDTELKVNSVKMMDKPFPEELNKPLKIRVISDHRSVEMSLGPHKIYMIPPILTTGNNSTENPSVTGEKVTFKSFKITQLKGTGPSPGPAAPLSQPAKK